MLLAEALKVWWMPGGSLLTRPWAQSGRHCSSARLKPPRASLPTPYPGESSGVHLLSIQTAAWSFPGPRLDRLTDTHVSMFSGRTRRSWEAAPASQLVPLPSRWRLHSQLHVTSPRGGVSVAWTRVHPMTSSHSEDLCKDTASKQGHVLRSRGEDANRSLLGVTVLLRRAGR